jgi:2-aminoethylphosphonate-pyruvate transaminase
MSMSSSSAPLLLTPGPLTTTAATREAMLRDWGSRDTAFIEMNARVRRRLLELAGVADSHECVPVQGSGTFAVEAAIGTLLPRDGHLLILVNGAYGRRMARICDVIGRRASVVETAEDTPVDPAALDAALSVDPRITHVAVVHCETTSGILNPLTEVAEVAARHDRALLIDAMSSFGALPLDGHGIRFDALMASSNKCLEGVPGLAYVIVRRSALETTAGNAHSLSLDLHDQWTSMQSNGQWRFTPPTHVVAAFDAALAAHAREGGVAGRHDRYAENCRVLVDGMRALGFETLLPDHLQAPIIVTFHAPSDPAFRFDRFYARLAERGFVIYPGKLTIADTFRIGCIGALDADDIRAALSAIAATLHEMGVQHCGRNRSA